MRSWMSVAGATALLAVATGCAPTVRMEVMRAADITVPAKIQTVAIVDRSRARNVGQGVLGAIEGVLTGEAIGADNEGRSQAMSGLAFTLSTSPRYEVVQPILGDELERSLFDRELSWGSAERICRQAGCDAIISLEAFDSDSSIDVDRRERERTLDDGRKVTETEWTARRTTRVLTAWRMYWPEERRLVDDLRDRSDSRTWRETGRSRQEAVNDLPSQYETIRRVGYAAGREYALRVAPAPIIVSRVYYGRGSDEIKHARRYMKARDFDGAARVLEPLLDHPEPKVRGRAAYDLAVVRETQGRLDDALVLAREAAVTLSNGRSRRYVFTIEQRIRDRDRLNEQLALPPEEGDEFTDPRPGTTTRPTRDSTTSRPDSTTTRPR